MIIIVVGAGSFGTALSNALAQNNNNKVIILGRDKNVIQSINFNRINFKYFPFITLNGNIRARREHGVQLTMIHWISEEKLLKLKRIIEKKNKTRR
jgi:glycerol-3-phosphate dehydrogenase